MSDVQEINKNDWNKFALDNNCSFLQSWEWGEFQESFGRRVFRLSGNGWQAQFIEMLLPFKKKYWYCPRGPIIKSEIRSPESEINSKQIDEFTTDVKKEAGKAGIVFFRIGPDWPVGLELAAKLEIAGFKKLRYDIEPSQTLILDLGKSEEELLAQMHPKWRYNIGLANKKDVKIKIISNSNKGFDKYFEDFWRLMEQTVRRQRIRLHEKEYYRKQLTISSRQFCNLLFLAESGDDIIAANIVNLYNGLATYLHGGSDGRFRNLMAPHLLQWEQIGKAREQGCAQYDFWGINEKKWPGVTRFKRGFGGREVNYIGTWDYAIDKKWHLLYKGVQKLRR